MTATRSRAKAKGRTNAKGRSERGVDPRMQARRASVARREGMRRLWIVAALTLVASIAIGLIAAANSSWLDIESVSVVGSERSNGQQIITASGISIGEPLVEIDHDASVAAVERVPWVAEAIVVREWNGTVTITVTERVGIVAIPTDARFAMVDRTGLQLELVERPPDGFVPVSGVNASGVPGQPVSDAAMSVVTLVGALTPAVREVTEEIVVEDGRLLLALNVGGRADLGDVRDIDNKLVALETILARVDLTCLAVIDVRVPSAPTVSRTGYPDSEEPLGDQGGC